MTNDSGQPLFDTPGWAMVQGASRGIGAALVGALLARREIRGVIATCRRPQAAQALAPYRQVAGDRLHVLALDVTDPPSIAAAAEAAAPICDGELRLVLNSAGILHEGDLTPEKRLEDIDASNLARAFAVNASGPILVARHFVPLLASRGRTRFASISARVGSISDNRLGGWYAYRASKAAQNMLTRTLAIELSRRLPDCVCVGLHPGTVDTDLSAPFRSGVPAERRFSPERAAAQLLEVLAGLGGDDSGGCFAWDGARIAP